MNAKMNEHRSLPPKNYRPLEGERPPTNRSSKMTEVSWKQRR